MPSRIPDLTAALAGNDSSKRQAAAEALAQLGEEAAPAAVALVTACGTDDEAREWIVSALESLGAPPDDSVAQLAKLAGNPAQDVAYWAVTLLGRAKAAAAVSALADALAKHPAIVVRQRAAWALGQIGPPAAAARGALEAAAADPDSRLASLAREALGQLGG